MKSRLRGEDVIGEDDDDTKAQVKSAIEWQWRGKKERIQKK